MTRGAFNVAADGPDAPEQDAGSGRQAPAFGLSPICANWGIALLGTARLDLERYLPIEPDYLRYPWVGDLTRMREELGFVPRYTADETLREFAAQLRLGRYRTGSISLAQDEVQMRELIERRRRDRARQDPPGADLAEGQQMTSNEESAMEVERLRPEAMEAEPSPADVETARGSKSSQTTASF